MARMNTHPLADDLDIPKFKLSPALTECKEYKRCFKLCIKEINQPFLSSNEESCSYNLIENCLNKYIQTQKFLAQKMNIMMEQQISQDPKLKIAFTKQKLYSQPKKGSIESYLNEFKQLDRSNDK